MIVENDFAHLYCNSSIYSFNNIKETIAIYQEVCTINTKKLGNYIILSFSQKQGDFSYQELTGEFINYLNSLEYQQGGQV
jgi:hypothetical protein